MDDLGIQAANVSKRRKFRGWTNRKRLRKLLDSQSDLPAYLRLTSSKPIFDEVNDRVQNYLELLIFEG